MQAPFWEPVRLSRGEAKDGHGTAVIAEGCGSAVGRGNLLHQMQSQNVRGVGIRAGAGKEVFQNRFRIAPAVVPDFQHKLISHNFRQNRDAAA